MGGGASTFTVETRTTPITSTAAAAPAPAQDEILNVVAPTSMRKTAKEVLLGQLAEGADALFKNSPKGISLVISESTETPAHIILSATDYDAGLEAVVTMEQGGQCIAELCVRTDHALHGALQQNGILSTPERTEPDLASTLTIMDKAENEGYPGIRPDEATVLQRPKPIKMPETRWDRVVMPPEATVRDLFDAAIEGLRRKTPSDATKADQKVKELTSGA